jgi:N-acetylneuraminic acid mutarotase
MEADLGTPLQLQTGTYYWIAAIGDADVPMYVTTNGAGYFLNTNPNGWNMLDSTFPAGGSMNYEMTPNFYVVLQDQ